MQTLLEKMQFVFSNLIRITIIIALIGAALNSRWTVVFVSTLALILTFLPAMIERNYRLSLPAEFEIIMVFFIYSSLFLGEVHDYYTRFWWWDIVLHTGSGLAVGFIGFLILFILYDERKIRAKPISIAIFTFCFGLAIGALWEIFEFGMDNAFGLNMQKSGLTDTMWDLIVDAGGALVSAMIGFIYLKGGKTRLFKRLMLKFMQENPRLFLRRELFDDNNLYKGKEITKNK